MDRDLVIIDIQNILDCCCGEYDEFGTHVRNLCYDCEYYCNSSGFCMSYNKKQAKALYDAGYRKVADDEIVESMKTYERARQETARDILLEVVNAWNTGNLNQREIAYICTRYGIELED